MLGIKKIVWKTHSTFMAISLGCTFLLPLLAEASTHLTKAIKSLNVVAGLESEFSGDINSNQKTGLEEAIYELQLASGLLVLPVATPTL